MSNRADILVHIRDQLNGRGRYVLLSRDQAWEFLVPKMDTARPMWAGRVHWMGGTVVAHPSLWPKETFRQCACGQRPKHQWRETCPDCNRPFSFCRCDHDKNNPWC